MVRNDYRIGASTACELGYYGPSVLGRWDCKEARTFSSIFLEGKTRSATSHIQLSFVLVLISLSTSNASYILTDQNALPLLLASYGGSSLAMIILHLLSD